MQPANRFFINGKDFWNIYSVIVESGSDGFLKYPSAKKTITRDWADANGLDVDVSKFYFNSRNITLNCAFVVNTEEEFHLKQEAFFNEWMKPGLKRIEVTEYGLRSYYCIYVDNGDYDRITGIKNVNKIGIKFTLNITELEPQYNPLNIFIVTEDNRFLIT